MVFVLWWKFSIFNQDQVLDQKYLQNFDVFIFHDAFYALSGSLRWSLTEYGFIYGELGFLCVYVSVCTCACVHIVYPV